MFDKHDENEEIREDGTFQQTTENSNPNGVQQVPPVMTPPPVQSYTQNSYSSYRQETNQQPFGTQPIQQPNQPKKKSFLPKLAGLVAGMALISFLSIQCYQAVDGSNKTFRAFFNKNGNSSSSSTVAATPDTTPNANQTANTDSGVYSGPSWIELASKDDTMSTTEIVDKVMPSVVGVSSTFQWQEQYSSWPFGGDMQTQDKSGTATGTGIIMSKDGYIITNAHVIYDSNYGKAAEISVVLSENANYSETEYPATIVGYDTEADIAVLKVNATDLVAAEFGDSNELQVGELALAIGNPLGFELFGSVSCGIISALNREVTINENSMKLIQTDAAINSGNSGGPLINSSGQVIGINSAKLSSNYTETTIEGLGFAIPITEATKIINDLINYGYVTGKPQIGITTEDVSETTSRMYGIPVGVFVTKVTEGGAAAQAGIQKRDVIIAANDKTVKTADELNDIKNQFSAGDTLKLTVTRGDEDLTINVVLQEQKPEAAK